jgi:hypothetical protein
VSTQQHLAIVDSNMLPTLTLRPSESYVQQEKKNSEYSPEEPYVHPFVPPENDTDTTGTGVIFGS